MIPVLYEYNTTSYSSFLTFGIGALKDATSCEVTEERNGSYELVLKYPLSGPLIKEIKKERLIKAQTKSPSGAQIFRIYRISAPIAGIITVYAQHISYDLSGVIALPCSFTNSNPYQIMSYILSNKVDASCPFSSWSDISTTSAFKIDRPRSFRNVLGGDKNSLTSIFGGELEFDGFTIKLHNNRGADRGVSILYGKNMTKLEHNSDLTEVYTHLYPYAVIKSGDTETLLTLTEKTIAITTTSSVRKTLTMDFSSSFSDGTLEATEANLRTLANNYLSENLIGIDSPNITLSFEELRNQLGYQNLHETINLCDVVTVKYPDLDINVKTKVVKVVYDTLNEKYKSITLGTVKTSLADKVISLEDKVDGTEEKVNDVPSHIETAVTHATEMITGATGGCVVLDIDANERPYELLIMDNYNKQNASNVWRWNIGGLGFSPNGYNGPYTTAFTSDGHIVADFIDTGTLDADIIKAGTIQALTGTSYWNLESGVLNLTGTINATSGQFDNCTINDTCNIYGYLWLEGTFQTQSYSGTTTYDFTTKLGGDGIVTEIEKRWSGSTYNSKNYIMPVGVLTVPDNYSNTSDSLVFGIVRDKTLRRERMMSGLFCTEQVYHSGSDFARGGELALSCDETEVLYANLYSDKLYVHWGAAGLDSFMLGDWYVSEDKNSCITTYYDSSGYNYYGKLSGYWYIDSRLYLGEQSPGSDYLGNISISGTRYPKLYGSWYASTFNLGNGSGYQIRMDNDQITFLYGSSEVGEIETYGTYVDIQGTWKTNGSAWISSSDEKVKNSIEDLGEEYSSFFYDLRPVSYKYNKGTSGRKHTGFIAQEMLKSMQNAGIQLQNYGILCAFGDPDDSETEWGVRYEELIALCVKEIQKLNKRVKELEEKK